METATSEIVKKSFQLTKSIPGFGNLYYKVRKKEQRIYDDMEVALLPETADSHIHANEWKIRKHSGTRLLKYLKEKQRPLRIMDAGCGNGWLSGAMASIDRTQVIGFDVNLPEIEQAKRVFEQKGNLNFVFGSLHTAMLLDLKFDIIVFSASIQYFPSLEKTLNDALSLLAPKGEIHIIDTHFYKHEQLDAAVLRTREYYMSLGFPEMTNHYFHHKMCDLKVFNHNILFNPENFLNKISKQQNPFYWIKITH